ncbi:13280_t:CDS:2, partial [Dentiscutata heterogama]
MGCITSKISEKADSIKSQSSQTEFQYIDGRRYQNAKGVIYPLPNDEEESERLHLQHFVIRYIWNSNFSAPVKHILSEPGSKILDVGYPLTEVVGLDQMLQKDYHLMITHTFDFVFQRYLVSVIPKEKWPYVINELVRVLKPGGFLELSELSNLFDAGPINQRLWHTGARIMEERGVDFNTYQKQKLEEYAQSQ